MFREEKLKNVICENVEKPLVIVLCPNYEERSIYISRKIKELANEIKRPIFYEVICLRNRHNNNMLLEGLKNKNFDILNENIEFNGIEYGHWLQYPNGFSPYELRSILRDKIEVYDNPDIQIDFLIDVSTMPKSMIFYLCESFQGFIGEYENKINKILFAYVQPEKYSSVFYAQDLGILNGFFSGRTLRSKRHSATVHSIIFPSRSGHEGKLLLDDLSLLPYEQHHTVFFPIDTKDYLQSLELMRANQTLLDGDSHVHQFYCSISDAVIALHDYFEEEIRELSYRIENNKIEKQLYLVAPFGAKIFLPISYFELQKLKKNKKLSDFIDIEICHTKGFQYTSVYSLGVGEINIFAMEVYDYVCKS